MLLEALDQTEETFFHERIQKRHLQKKKKKRYQLSFVKEMLYLHAYMYK